MGFCMGVKRAVEKAEQALAECAPGAAGAGGLASSAESGGHESGAAGAGCHESEVGGLGVGAEPRGRVYSLGPLIHNPTVLSDLEGRGLTVLPPDSPSFPDLKGASVLIRAHGTTPAVIGRLESAGARVIDATCPRVHLSQKRAGEWSGRGYDIVIAGDRNHGEVTSISSFASGKVFVVQNSSEAEVLVRGSGLSAQAVLIAQTTFSPVEFARISRILQEAVPDIVVFDSICSATMERQLALKELAQQVDGILVIGGKSSANTRRLYESARSLVPLADLIEDASMIREEFFALERVGITAGASTPEAVVMAVESALLGHRRR